MYKISAETLKNAYKPFDVVTDQEGNVGFINEVNCNESQPKPEHQISYSVSWLIGDAKTAWWDHDKLTSHCNLFMKIAEDTCHPSGNNSIFVESLFKSF